MDSQTLILILALSNCTLSIGLFLFDHGDNKSLSLLWWSRAKAIQGLAFGLLYADTQVPPLISLFFSNCLLLTGVAVEVWATENDEMEADSALLWACIISPILFAGVYFSALDSHLKRAFPYFLLGIFYLVGAVRIWRPWKTMTRLHRCLGLMMGTLAGMVVAISLNPSWSSHEATILPNHSILILYGLYCLMLINGFGNLLLNRERQSAELARMAWIDPLTQAPNRRGFFNALAPWLALARRHGGSTALILFDLDHLKRINDDYGHSVGDQVLKEVVDIGQKQLRDSDLIGRLGGEEFAVLLPRTDLADAHLVAERMRQAIMALRIKLDAEKAVLTTTASFGVTTIRPDDTMVSLVKRADDALSGAKSAGCNHVMEAAPVAELLE